MDELAKEHIIDVYSRSLLLHGPSRPEAVFWSSSGQAARFEAISSLIPCTEGISLLDYGCGLGDLLSHLLNKGYDLIYRGTDINPQMIEAAQIKHPGAEFRVFDIEEDAPAETSDITVLCGVFNYMTQGVNESFMKTLRLLLDQTRMRLIFTALSALSIPRQYYLNLHEPEALLARLRDEVSASAVMDTDAVPGDIIISIDK